MTDTRIHPRKVDLPSKVLTEGNLRALPVFPLQKGRSRRFKSKDGYRVRLVRPAQRNGKTTMTLWEVQGPLQPSDKATFMAVESFITEEYLSRGREVPDEVRIPSYRTLHDRIGRDVPGKWDHEDLKESLRRIHRTALTTEAAWKEKGSDGSEQWINANFHLYSNVFVRGETRPDGKQIVRGAVIVLDRIYRASLNGNNVIPLDYELWRGVKNPVARRLLEILSVKFYGLTRNQGSSLNQDYAQLCDILPLEPRRYLSDAKKSLRRAHDELLDKNFLAIAPEWTWQGSDRSIRYTPGDRFYAFQRRREPLTTPTTLELPDVETADETTPETDPLTEELTVRGMNRAVARRLVGEHDHDLIRHHLDVHDQEKGSGERIENPGGWLRQRIVENWTPFDGYLTPAERQRADDLRRDEAKKRRDEDLERKRETARWNTLTPEQKAEESVQRWRSAQEAMAETGMRRPVTEDELKHRRAHYLREYQPRSPVSTSPGPILGRW